MSICIFTWIKVFNYTIRGVGCQQVARGQLPLGGLNQFFFFITQSRNTLKKPNNNKNNNILFQKIIL